MCINKPNKNKMIAFVFRDFNESRQVMHVVNNPWPSIFSWIYPTCYLSKYDSMKLF